MKFCPVCSRKIDDNVKICPYCNTGLGVKEVQRGPNRGNANEDWGNGTIYVDSDADLGNANDIDDNKWGSGTVFADQDDLGYFEPVEEKKVVKVNRQPQRNPIPAPQEYQIPSGNMSIKKEKKNKQKEPKVAKEKKIDLVTLVVRVVLILIIAATLLAGIAYMLLK